MAAAPTTRVQSLAGRSEYRFELEKGERLSVKLRRGDADVFGAELATDRWYAFGDEAKVAIAGTASTDYVADEPSPTYTSHANLHLNLERWRLQARDELRRDSSSIAALASSDEVLSPSPPQLSSSADGTTAAAESASSRSAYRPEGQGPRVMVIGPEDAGKTSLVKFLANMALRSPALCSIGKARTQEKKAVTAENARDDGDYDEVTGWWPIIVNLDPSPGAAPLPCTLGALPLGPLPLASLPSPSPALPFGTTSSISGHLTASASVVQGVSPLALWLGRENTRDNEVHARRVVDWLAQGVERRMVRDLRARASGLIVDTAGITAADGRNRYSFIQHCVRAFHINIIVVIGHEKLNIEMTRAFAGEGQGVAVLKIPKSGGVVELDDTYRQRLRDLQVRAYFYGGSIPAAVKSGDGADGSLPAARLPGHEEALGGLPTLNPYSMTIPLDLLQIFRVGQESMAPSSALPIGLTRTVTETQLVKLDPVNSTLDQSTILHAVLALVQAPGADIESDNDAHEHDDKILGAPVVGYIHVTSIDVTRKKLTILSPASGRLPSKVALLGSLDWQDA